MPAKRLRLVIQIFILSLFTSISYGDETSKPLGLSELFKLIRDPAVLNDAKAEAIRTYISSLEKSNISENTELPKGDTSTTEAKAPDLMGKLDELYRKIIETEIKSADGSCETLGCLIEKQTKKKPDEIWQSIRAEIDATFSKEAVEKSPVDKSSEPTDPKAWLVKSKVILELMQELIAIEQDKIFAVLTPGDHPSARITAGAELSKDLFYIFQQLRGIISLIASTKNLGSEMIEAFRKLKDDPTRLGEKFSGAREKFFEEYIPQVLSSAERLGVYYAKLLQTVGTFAYLFSSQAYGQFSHLQNKLNQNMPIQAVHDIIKEDLGAPVSSLFVEIDPLPFASASIAQVHRAKIRVGGKIKNVVIKVLKQGVAEELEWNIRINRLVFKYFSRLSDNNFFVDLISQQVEQLGISFQGETIFLNELERLKKWRTLYSLDRGISLPKSYRRLSSARLITMDEIENADTSDFATLLGTLPQKPQDEKIQKPIDELKNSAAKILTSAGADAAEEASEVEPKTNSDIADENKTAKIEEERSMLAAFGEIYVSVSQKYGFRLGSQYLQILRSALPYAGISLTTGLALGKVDEAQLTLDEAKKLGKIKANSALYHRAFWTQALYIGELHADLQPANILQNDSGIFPIDLGNTVKTRGLIYSPLSLVLNVGTGDAKGVLRGLKKMGRFSRAVDDEIMIATIEKVFEKHNVSKIGMLDIVKFLAKRVGGKKKLSEEPPPMTETETAKAEETKAEDTSEKPATETPKKDINQQLQSAVKIVRSVAKEGLRFPLRWLKYKTLAGVHCVTNLAELAYFDPVPKKKE